MAVRDMISQGSGCPGSVGGDTRSKRPVTIPPSLRVCYTQKGPVLLTPTEMQIIGFVRRHEGKPVSKAQIAAVLGRNEKTVSRLVSRLRQYGILEIEPSYAANGAQLANAYRIANPMSKEE